MVESNIPANKDAAMEGPMEEDKNQQTSTDSTFTMLDAHADMRELTNLELIRKAEDCADKLKLEKAISLYDEGIRRFPNDTLIIDQYTDLLIQLNEMDKAKGLIERSIQLNPHSSGQKFMNLAEMLKGVEAV